MDKSKQDGINVLSLFDGISCGQIALQRAGIKVNQYFASEIDKHAIKVTQHHYPNTLQLGSVVDISVNSLPEIQLLIGGSPCQGFSFAGKQLNFDDPRSKLFFEYVRILKEIRRVNPNVYFLLENVKMKKEWKEKVSSILEVQPYLINSANFSAQSRERLYWTNIPILNMGCLNNDFLCNILEAGVLAGFYLFRNYKLKSLKSNESRIDILRKNYRNSHKKYQQKPILVSEIVDDTPSGRSRQTDRLYSIFSKCPTLLANRASDLKIDSGTDDITQWRTLTPVECERLQTVPEDYTSCISDNQRYKVLGNGWTVDVIAHIFSFLPDNWKCGRLTSLEKGV